MHSSFLSSLFASLWKTVFWRLFANYFVLILIPVIAACIIVQVLVVRLIEEDARMLNEALMSQFTHRIDAEIEELRTDMIHLLNTSNIRSLIGAEAEPMYRSELIRILREQLIQLQTHELVSNAYLYFVGEDLVIDANLYADKAYYFDIYRSLGDPEKAELMNVFVSKKMMDFVPWREQETLAIISYPFHSQQPDVYLAVHLDQSKLQQLIRPGKEWVMGTAIVSLDGQVLSQAGILPEALNWGALGSAGNEETGGSRFQIYDKQALSVIPSQFSDRWRYISMIDLDTLMRPADLTRTFIWIFLAFFLVVGSIISYLLTRRMYQPILEIKEGLCSHPELTSFAPDGEDEFDVIKRYSERIMTEHQKLSQLIQGMKPIVHEHFIAKIVTGQYRDELSIEMYAKEIGFAYSKKASRTVFCIGFHFSAEYETMTESSRSFLMAELKERIQQLLPDPVWICQTEPDQMAVIVQKDPLFSLSSMEDADILKLALQLYGNYFKATIGIGSTVSSIEDLHLSYQLAQAALQQRNICADVDVCTGGGLPEPAWRDSFLSVQEVTRMLNLCRAGEYGKLLNTALDIVDEGIRMNAAAAQMKYLCLDILNTWIRAVEQDRKDFDVSFYAGVYHRLNRCITGAEMKACFREVHSLLFRQDAAQECSAKFQEILAYIDEHYSEDLTLEVFAERLQMSVGHFSRTFKEEVGVKYVDYIAQVRLNKAKELLLTTNWKIDEIAEKVGYWGRSSFIRMFRKYEGVTPAQYRVMHRFS